MTIAEEIAEKVLIDIHWQGKKSEHSADIKWLSSRVECLGREIAAKLEPVKKAIADHLAGDCGDTRGLRSALALFEEE